ncbi:phage integrase N-terminal SAM-like domain-containing protein [Bathymodiolus thermophilus thioautotrophic gill symbiont]|uniref:phage integrase N-terminal SAM-like domain-containing protein n=1 Tax=Bathymodiolus thermophilus thioautotrophic gill symbiont TaxID=2360 RepID=UPI0026D4478C
MTIINKNKTILQKVREVLRRQRYAYSTEIVYLDWVGRFIGFYQLKTNNLCLKTPGKRWENI